MLEIRQLSLGIDDVGQAQLPNGNWVRVKPLLIDAKGALLAVELEGSLDAQLRVRGGQLVVLGPQKHAGGQLVVSLQSQF